jgi:hypothetical protein
MVLSKKEVHLSVAVQVPTVDGLKTAFGRDIEICTGCHSSNSTAAVRPDNSYCFLPQVKRMAPHDKTAELKGS